MYVWAAKLHYDVAVNLVLEEAEFIVKFFSRILFAYVNADTDLTIFIYRWIVNASLLKQFVMIPFNHFN